MVVATTDEEVSYEHSEDFYQYVEEGRSKCSDFDKSLNKRMAQDSIPDYDETALADLQDTISKLYLSIKSMEKPLLANRVGHGPVSFTQERNGTLASTANTLRLPRLTLKTFNRAPELWINFLDFTSLQFTITLTYRKLRHLSFCYHHFSASLSNSLNIFLSIPTI